MSCAWLDDKVGLKARDSLGVVTTMLRDMELATSPSLLVVETIAIAQDVAQMMIS